MVEYLISILAGRVAAVLCAVTILLPYWLRRNRTSSGSAREVSGGSYLDRLWPHVWLGYLILILSIIHAGTDTAAMARANPAGIWAATIAFLLLVVELMLGLQLREQRLRGRRTIRRLHFWTMTAFVAGVGIPLWFNAT